MGRHFKSKRSNMMVTWMHWMLANMAFIIIFKCQESTHGQSNTRKGGMLWIDAVYNLFEDGNIWTWANTEDEITAIKTSPTTEQELCGVMDAQMDYAPPIYQPLIVGH